MSENSGHDFSSYFKRAVSPLMVLALLRGNEMYGYEITQEINRRTNKKLSIAVLYPVLIDWRNRATYVLQIPLSKMDAQEITMPRH